MLGSGSSTSLVAAVSASGVLLSACRGMQRQPISACIREVRREATLVNSSHGQSSLLSMHRRLVLGTHTQSRIWLQGRKCAEEESSSRTTYLQRTASQMLLLGLGRGRAQHGKEDEKEQTSHRLVLCSPRGLFSRRRIVMGGAHLPVRTSAGGGKGGGGAAYYCNWTTEESSSIL